MAEKLNDKQKQILALAGLGGLFLMRGKLTGAKNVEEQKIDMANDVEKQIQETKDNLNKLTQDFLNKIQQGEQLTAQQVSDLLNQLEATRQKLDQLSKQQEDLATQLAQQKSIDIEKQFLEINAQLKETKLQEAQILAQLQKSELEKAENQRLVEALQAQVNNINEAFANIEQTLAKIKEQSNIDIAQVLQMEAQAKQEALQLIQQAQETEEKIKIAYEKAVELATEYEKLDAQAREKLAEALTESQKQLAKQLEEEMYKMAEEESKARLRLADQQTQLAQQLYQKAIEYTDQMAQEASKAREEQARVLKEYAQQLADIEHQYATQLAEEGQKALEKAMQIEAEARERLATETAEHIKSLEEKNLAIMQGLNALIQALPVSIQATITKQVPQTIIDNYNYISDLLAITDLMESMANNTVKYVNITYLEKTPSSRYDYILSGFAFYIAFPEFDPLKLFTTPNLQKENTTLNDIYNLQSENKISEYVEEETEHFKTISFNKRFLQQPLPDLVIKFKSKYGQFYPPIYNDFGSFKVLKDWLDIQLFQPLNLPMRKGTMDELKIPAYILGTMSSPGSEGFTELKESYLPKLNPPNTQKIIIYIIDRYNGLFLFKTDNFVDFWKYICSFIKERESIHRWWLWWHLFLTTKDFVNSGLKRYNLTNYLIP